MRAIADLITAARLVARNVANADGSYTIGDTEIIQYLNDAQERMQNKISATKNISKMFVTEAIISVVTNQEGYTVPDRVLLNKQIEAVDFSATGNLGDYIRLEKLNMFNRDTNPTTYPWGYFKRGNQILLQPTPSLGVGSIRVVYERKLDNLASITDTVNGTPSGTSIIVNTGSSSYVANAFLNVISPYGVTLLRNGLIQSYNGGSKTITLAANVSTYLVGTAALADLASCSVVLGKYTTYLSQLPDDCERFLIHYAAAELFRKDSSEDYSRALQLLANMEEDIITALKSQTAEVQFIPQQDRFEYW